jgi:hypothetical protein
MSALRLGLFCSPLMPRVFRVSTSTIRSRRKEEKT